VTRVDRQRGGGGRWPSSSADGAARTGHRDTPDAVSNESKVGMAPASVASPTAGQDFEALKLNLARMQLRLVDAQRYVSRSLSTSSLSATRPELEEAVARALKRCLTATADAEVEAAALVDRVAGREGVAGLALLTDIFEAQVAGLRYELQGEPDQAPHETRLAGLLDRVARASLTHLAQADPAPDATRAMQSMLAANRALSPGDSATALYTLGSRYDKHFHPYTNEKGLPRLAQQLDVRGGAAVGVSGAILDIGALGADLVISLDSDPDVQDAMVAFTGVLLLVDQHCREQGWDDQRRCTEVQRRLRYPSKASERRQLIGELRSLGLPPELEQRLPALMEAMWRALVDAPDGIWSEADDAAPRIRHLTRLALEGRIVCLTGDLADPAVVDRVNTLLDLHASQAKVLHLSNALDYIPDIAGVCRNFQRLHRDDAASVSTSTWFLSPGWGRRGDAPPTAAEAMGSFDNPAALPASEWLKPGGLGDQLHQEAWQKKGHPEKLWQQTVSRVNCGVLDLNPHQAPEGFGEYQRQLDEICDRIFGDPGLAQQRLRAAIRGGSLAPGYEMALPPGGLDKIEVPTPTSFEELPRQAARFEARFWTPERKQRCLARLLEEAWSTDAQALPDLGAAADGCKDFAQLFYRAAALGRAHGLAELLLEEAGQEPLERTLDRARSLLHVELEPAEVEATVQHCGPGTDRQALAQALVSLVEPDPGAGTIRTRNYQISYP